MTSERQHEAYDDAPRLAIRRHTDRCFHAVEEVVPEGPIEAKAGGTAGVVGDKLRGPGGVRGYIVDGVMIDADDVAEVREIPDDGDKTGGGPDCLDINGLRQG